MFDDLLRVVKSESIAPGWAAGVVLASVVVYLTIGVLLDRSAATQFIRGVGRGFGLPVRYFGESLRRVATVLGSREAPARGWFLEGTTEWLRFTFGFLLVVATIGAVPASIDAGRDRELVRAIEDGEKEVAAADENVRSAGSALATAQERTASGDEVWSLALFHRPSVTLHRDSPGAVSRSA